MDSECISIQSNDLLTYCEVFGYFVELNITTSTVLYSTDSLSLDSFPNLLSIFDSIKNRFRIYSTLFMI